MRSTGQVWTRRAIGALLALGLGLTLAVAQLGVTQTASAVSWSQLQQTKAHHADLKAQLAGVNAELAQKIIELDDLTSNQIPAAQQALDNANQQAQQAKDAAQAATERLKAAQQDKATLEEQIKQTGADYDDAHAAVAQIARDSFHSSQVGNILSIATGSADTDDFINSMQSQAALSRSEANVANDAANVQNLQMNRKDRLEAIERQIAQLKEQAEQQAAQAQQAADDAAQKKSELDTLRTQSEQRRKDLESQQGQLQTQAAREAAAIVAMQAEIDSWNQQNLGGQVNASTGDKQQIGNGGGSSSNTGGTNYGSASGMNYGVPGQCPEGAGFCYGHATGNTVGGSAYPERQCTLWAYIRRSQLGLPVGSYMGNGADWANTARRLGYVVNRTPHVGAVMVFARGQWTGSWAADPMYGHVAVVERVNADGSVLISQGGTGFATFPAYQTIYNTGAYEYVHY